MKEHKHLPLKKGDVIIIFTATCLALILFIIGLIINAGVPRELKVRGYQDGKLCFDHYITDEVRTTLYGEEGGQNTVVIHDQKVYMESADCHGQDCVHMGNISHSGEEIVCLPHKLAIRIEGGKTSSDTVVR